MPDLPTPTTDAAAVAPEADSPSKRRRWGIGLGALLLIAGGTLTIFAVNGEASTVEVEPPKMDLPTYVDGKITFSDGFRERAGLTFEAVTKQHLEPVVEATGTVDFSPHHVAAVGARIFGRVMEVGVIPGDKVEPGDLLARFESAELGEAQAELMTLRARAELAEADQRRKELLVREGLTSRRAVEVTEKELEATRAQERAAVQQVSTMLGGKGGRGKKMGEFNLASPIAGEIVAVNVYQGQAVEPSHTAFQVADLSELWVELAVFERDLPLVAAGDYVRVQVRGGDGIVVPGVVAHVGSVLDPVTRTATVRVVVENDDRRLRVSQSVVAYIESQTGARTVVAVPSVAVVLVDGAPTVFVITEPGVVEPRTVELGATGDDSVEIVSGLEEGEQIVVDGVFALKSEIFR